MARYQISFDDEGKNIEYTLSFDIKNGKISKVLVESSVWPTSKISRIGTSKIEDITRKKWYELRKFHNNDPRSWGHPAHL